MSDEDARREKPSQNPPPEEKAMDFAALAEATAAGFATGLGSTVGEAAIRRLTRPKDPGPQPPNVILPPGVDRDED